MSDNIPLLTVPVLLEEIKEVTSWYMLGAYLNVPVYQLNKIQSTNTQDGVERCKLEMLQYWLNTTMNASWKDVIRALEQLDMLTLAARLKSKFLWTSPRESGQSVEPQPVDNGTNPSTDTNTLVANVKVVSELQDLESDFSDMMTDTKKDLADCDIGDIQFYLDDLIGIDEFRKCQNIDEVLRKLRRDHIDTFNIRYLERLISRFHRSDAIVKSVEEYKEKKEQFLQTTTVKQFQNAVISQAEIVRPKGKAVITIKIPKEYGIPRTLKDVEELAKKAFKDCHNNLIRINVTPGSIIITWYIMEGLCEELVRLAQENIAVLREEGVEEVSIVGEKIMTISTHKVTFAEATEQHDPVSHAELNTKLKITENELQESLLTAQEAELKERRKMVGDLKELVQSYFPSSLIQIAGDGKKSAYVGQETTVELSVSSQANTPLLFPINHLSCKLTDPRHQRVPCSITSTQPGVCTVTYTPLLRGPHQLRIAIRDTIREIKIPGSPFTVNVKPTLEMRGMVQHDITGILNPWGVAVSRSGKVVVSTNMGHCISVYSRAGKKLWSFGSEGSKLGQFKHPHSIAITTDNHILVADESNHRIQMFTLKGRFVTTVGQKGKGPLQFNHPSGIAVHPSGRVFVGDTDNHRIQVLNHDLTYSHILGSEGSAPGQFSNPCGVACDNSGVVYVTDSGNHRVQLFSSNGQFSTTFGSKGSQHGQLYHPNDICIDDSTNTVHVCH